MEFSAGQSDARWITRCGRPGQVGLLLLDTQIHQKGSGEQHEGDMAVPAEKAANFILIQSQMLADLQVFVG